MYDYWQDSRPWSGNLVRIHCFITYLQRISGTKFINKYARWQHCKSWSEQPGQDLQRSHRHVEQIWHINRLKRPKQFCQNLHLSQEQKWYISMPVDDTAVRDQSNLVSGYSVLTGILTSISSKYNTLERLFTISQIMTRQSGLDSQYSGQYFT